MRRTIVEPADLSSAALADLKSWLGITRPNEDELLLDLLRSGIAMCEAFTGQAPLSQLIEERVATRAASTILSSRPVVLLNSVELIAQDGTRTTLDSARFAFELLSEGRARFELLADEDGQAIAVRFRSGIGDSWENVPAPLKQGLIRLSAYHYRDRDRTGGSKSETVPPASVSALWRPWRNLRLS